MVVKSRTDCVDAAGGVAGAEDKSSRPGERVAVMMDEDGRVIAYPVRKLPDGSLVCDCGLPVPSDAEAHAEAHTAAWRKLLMDVIV